MRGVALGTGSGSFWQHIRKMFSELYPVRQPDHPRKLGEAVSPWRQGTGLIRGGDAGELRGPEQQNHAGGGGHLESLL